MRAAGAGTGRRASSLSLSHRVLAFNKNVNMAAAQRANDSARTRGASERERDISLSHSEKLVGAIVYTRERYRTASGGLRGSRPLRAAISGGRERGGCRQV